jgi:hypothetical protein
MKVNITGLPLEYVLLVLYNNAKSQGPNAPAIMKRVGLQCFADLSDMEKVEAMIAAGNSVYNVVDFGAGERELRVTIGGAKDEFDATFYDAQHGGIGYALKVINDLTTKLLQSAQPGSPLEKALQMRNLLSIERNNLDPRLFGQRNMVTKDKKVTNVIRPAV